MSVYLRTFSLLIVLTSFLNAASISVSVSPQNPSEGEAVSYSLTLTGAKSNPNVIAFPKSPGLSINWQTQPSTSRSMSFDNRTGQKVTLTFTWKGRANKKGNHTINPMIIQVDGQRLTSKSLPFNVMTQQTSAFYLFQTSLSAKECFVGQSLELSFDFLMAEQEIQKYEQTFQKKYELANYHYNAIKLNGEWTKDYHITPKKFRQVQGANAYVGSNSPSVKIGDFYYRRHQLTFTIEPKKTGTFTIPAMQQQFYKINFRRSFFGVEAQRINRPIAASSKAITLKVLTPPNAGQPTSYKGQVCTVLNAELLVPDLISGQEVQLHAPIPVQIKLSGDINPASILMPNWNAQSELLKIFEISAQSMTRDDEKNHCLFSEIVFRPKDTSLTAIPSIEFSYFDPIKKAYKVAKTKPFPIKVQAVDESLQLEDQPLALLELKKEKQKTKTIGRIEGLEVNSSKLFERSEKSWPMLWIVIASFGPILLVTLLHCLRTFSSHKSNKQHSQRFKASGTIKTIQAAQLSSEILEAVNKFISKEFNVTDPRKAKLSSEAMNHLETLLASLEAASYAPEGSNQDTLKTQALELIQMMKGEKVS